MRNNDSGSLATAFRTNCSAASSGKRPATGITSIASAPNCFAIFTTKYCFMSLIRSASCSWFPSTPINPVLLPWFRPPSAGFFYRFDRVKATRLRCKTEFVSVSRDAACCVSADELLYRFGSTSTYSASITPSSFFCSCPEEAPPPSVLAPPPGKPPPGCAPPLG